MANEASAATQKQAWTLWAALLGGQVLVAAVAFFFAPIAPVDPNLHRILPLIAIAMSLVTAAVSIVLGLRAVPTTRGAVTQTAAQLALQRQLMRWAMLEGAFLFAAVAYLLTASPLVLPAAILSLAVYVLSAPRGLADGD